MEIDINEILQAYAQEVANLTTRLVLAEARATAAEKQLGETPQEQS